MKAVPRPQTSDTPKIAIHRLAKRFPLESSVVEALAEVGMGALDSVGGNFVFRLVAGRRAKDIEIAVQQIGAIQRRERRNVHIYVDASCVRACIARIHE